VITASFFLLRLLPGSPFDEGRNMDSAILAQMEAKYGLDLPLIQQYLNYITKLVFEFDLGPSLKYPNRDVVDILIDAIPVSLILGCCAILIAIAIGFLTGLSSALIPNSKLGRLSKLFASFAMSMPSFVYAGILITIFGLKLNLLPVALWEGPEYVILPAFTLAIAPSAYISRITSSAITETLRSPHIQTAYSKGLTAQQVFFKHILSNSLIPILTIIGPLTAVLITGSFVVEFVFALPGMGKYFVTAFINRDYFLVSGVIIIFSLILLSVNTIVDLINMKLDPRSTRN
jgi:oligopeptide transport system permease protein